MIVLQPGQESLVSDILNEVLVCPVDHEDLKIEGEYLVCTECGARFSVENGVPNLLVDSEPE